jgi:hypothetical protein
MDAAFGFAAFVVALLFVGGALHPERSLRPGQSHHRE